MAITSPSPGREDASSLRLVVASVLGVFVVFVVLQLIGDPNSGFTTLSTSLLYSLLVYVPVFVVCALALKRAK